ncbi:phage scaffolding protein [Streptomyces sp. LARHCF252]
MSDLINSAPVADTEVDAADTTHQWTPPTREEWEALLDKKKTADAEAASRKRWLRDLGYDPKTGHKITDAVVSDAEAEGEAEGQEPKAEPAQVDTASVATAETKTAAIFIALAEAGVGAKSLARASKLIDKASISLGSDGISGLSEQIEALQEELPELFKRSRNTPVADASAVGAGKKQAPAADQTKGYAQRLAESILKG